MSVLTLASTRLPAVQPEIAMNPPVKRILKVFCGSYVFGVVGSVTFFDKIGYLATVDGRSMQPSLNPVQSKWRDIIFCNRWAIQGKTIHKGEIVSLVEGLEPNTPQVHRVESVLLESKSEIGLQTRFFLSPPSLLKTITEGSPNDPNEVLVKRIVALEGETIRTLGYKTRYVTVPEGHCWIEGDNHKQSLDSNFFGPVAVGLVHSKATHILWPPHRFQRLKSELASDRIVLDRRKQDQSLEDHEDEYDSLQKMEVL